MGNSKPSKTRKHVEEGNSTPKFEGNLPKSFVKIVVMGASESGKSSLIQRFVEDTFGSADVDRIAPLIRTKTLHISGYRVDVKIYDTQRNAPIYEKVESYRASDIGIITLDLTSKEESEAILTDHIAEFKELKELPNPVVVVFGAKADCETSPVSMEEGQSLVRRLAEKNIFYYEVSSKTGFGVQEAFKHFLKALWVDKFEE